MSLESNNTNKNNNNKNNNAPSIDQPVSCPALFLTAPASGQGKTTITAALARLLTRQGKVVRIFKTGPDYLDPQVLAQASGQTVIPLDLWMAGDQWCQNQLYQAALSADLILIEGAMGMFDGEPSSADLAARFGIPLVIIMNVKGMAQTAAAVAVGLANFRDDITVAGLIANQCGSDRHRQLIEDALPDTLPLLTCVPRADDMSLPERHLGLVQANEVSDTLEQRFNKGADYLALANIDALVDAAKAVLFHPSETISAPSSKGGVSHQALLQNRRIAIAKDEAFSFIYDANVEMLRNMGADIVFFSPIHDKVVPDADALWLPGGYPELHAGKLFENKGMRLSIKAFYELKKPVLAECGGFLYTLDGLTDLENKRYIMSGLLAGEGAMRGKRGCQGMQIAPLPEGNINGHAHHRSRSDITIDPVAYGRRQRHPAPGEPIYRQGSLTATYLHLFFPSNPLAIADLFKGSLIRRPDQKLDNDLVLNHHTGEKKHVL